MSRLMATTSPVRVFTAVTAVVLLAGATGEGPPPMNLAVVGFAREHLGEAVGNGECTTLAIEALRFSPRGLTVLQSHAPIGYLLGRMEASLPLEDTRFGARPWTTSRGSAA